MEIFKYLLTLFALLVSGMCFGDVETWQFSPKTRFDGNNFSDLKSRSYLVSVPHYWSSDDKMTSYGYGTYFRQIKVPIRKGSIIQIPSIGSAYQLYLLGADGTYSLLASRGVLGDEHSEELPDSRTQYIEVRNPIPKGSYWLLNVSNYSHYYGGVWGTLNLRGEDSFFQHDIQIDLSLVFIGMILLMTIYNFNMFANLRKDYTSMWLVGLSFACIVRAMSNSGLLYKYWEPSWVLFQINAKLSYVSLPMVITLSGYSHFFFAKDLKLNSKPLKALIWLCCLFIALILLAPVKIFAEYLPFYQFNLLLCLTYATWVVFLAMRQQLFGAKDSLVGLVVIGASASLDVYFTNTDYSQIEFYPMGMVVFLFIHSLLESKKFLNMRVQLRNEERNSSHLLGELTKLVYPHQAEMIRDNYRIEDTMPTSSQFACVISFDIQNSSFIDLEKNHDFFTELFTKFHKLVEVGYDPKNLSSNAYMIKEMGDGFLCSIGFPFVTLGNIYDHSFYLAQEFVKVFENQVLETNLPIDTYCSIGIACGTVTGYFPIAGLKQFDLYGLPIVKASRYESSRKDIWQHHDVEKGNIIILQDKVYAGLSAKNRQYLYKINLDKFQVRDDPEAKELYISMKALTSQPKANIDAS